MQPFVVHSINLNTSIVSGTGDGSGLRRERNGKLHASRGKNGKRTTDGAQRYRRHLRQNTIGQGNSSLSGDSRHRYRQRYVQLTAGLRFIFMLYTLLYTWKYYISSIYCHIFYTRKYSSICIFYKFLNNKDGD